MLLVAAFAALTIAVLAAIILPIVRRAPVAPARAQYDRAVYRDQLLEIDRDIARGLIGEREAQTARLEIQRRILASGATVPAPPTSTSRNPILALMLCTLVVAGSAALYLRLGSPGVPDEPFAARVIPNATVANDSQREVRKAAAALAEKLKANPSNKEGWLLYARTTAALGDWQNSTDAYYHAIELGADDTETTSAYGEVLVMAADGMVTPAARETFSATLAKDKSNPLARFYLALADAQAGEPQKAIDAWLTLAAEAPEGSAMRGEILRRIVGTAKAAGLPPPKLPPAAQQSDAVRGMVAQLAAKLEADPNDVDGWLRLGRSYGVLGDAEKSAAAYDRAAKLKPDDASIPLQEAETLLQNRPPDAPLPPRAIELLRRVETTEPNQPDVLWYLGAAAVQDNHLDEAEHYWQRLLPLLPAGGPDQKMVREALSALKPK